MKTRTKAWLVGLILLVGCHKDEKTIEPDGIRINQVVRIDANRSYIITKVNDSRCPIDGKVSCFWQGVAEVTVRLNQNSKTDTVKVATLDFSDGFYRRKRTTTLDGSTWTVELVNVWPYPTSFNSAPPSPTIVQLNVSVQ